MSPKLAWQVCGEKQAITSLKSLMPIWASHKKGLWKKDILGVYCIKGADMAKYQEEPAQMTIVARC